MSNLNNLVGQQFGRLTVLQRDTKKTKKVSWLCLCDCGNKVSVYSSNLTSGNTTSCGCKKVEVGKNKLKDLKGQRFGRWTVLFRDETKNGGNAYWICECDCGNIVEAVDGYNLTHGYTQSCGCLTISHGEKYILEYLEKRGLIAGIDYRTQVTFDNLKGVGNLPLSYDIELMGEHHCLIEYQGRQHFEAIPFFGGKNQLEIQLEHDKRKRNYARAHQIKLWEIPYEANTYDKVAQYMRMILMD